MKALVVGARGAVGLPLVEQLMHAGHAVTQAGRRAPDGGVSVDLRAGLREFAELAATHDVVINASGVEQAAIADALGSTALVDVSANGEYLAALELRADAVGASVVLGAGLAPGLSTAMVASLGAEPGDDIDLAIMLGAGEKHGAAAVAWTQGLIGRDVWSRPELESMMNLHEHRMLRGGDGSRRRYLRADFPDHTLLGETTGLRVRSYLALSSRPVTAALAAVARLPALKAIVAKAPAIGDDTWAVSALNRRTGEQLSATGRSQSAATARVTALLAERAVDQATHGPVTAAQLATIHELRTAAVG